MPERKAPWYTHYGDLSEQLAARERALAKRCAEMGVDRDDVLDGFIRDLSARIVHESNWQEGIYLEAGRTRELVDAVFDDLDFIPRPAP